MIRYLIPLVVSAMTVLGAPVDCATGTLGDYLSLSSGCRLGSVVVSDFFNPGVLPSSTEIDAASIGVLPLLDSSLPGLRFTYNADAGAGEVLQSILQFAVASPATGFATLRLIGGSASPGGAALATSELCSGAFVDGLCSGFPQVLGVFDIGSDRLDFARRDFATLTNFFVRFDAVADGGFDSSASLVAAELRFGQVPEPSTYQLGILAALSLAARHGLRRLKR
jgi:hypothetical protein